jgi:hypothetical protein
MDQSEMEQTISPISVAKHLKPIVKLDVMVSMKVYLAAHHFWQKAGVPVE